MNQPKRSIKIIDLSESLKNDLPGTAPPEITYESHDERAELYRQKWGLSKEEFPYKQWYASEVVNLSTHSGTHLDAPWHYGPVSENKPAKTIDQIPLEWCFSEAVLLDFSHKKKGELIEISDLKSALSKINYRIKPFDIVLIRTDASKHYAEVGYEDAHPGISKEATLWLIEQGVKVTGIDAYGWDRPISMMVQECKNGIRGKLWAAHLAGREKEYCHIEKLSNLDQIPKPFGFKVAVFPIKIEKASAGWVRAVAILEE